MQQTMPSITFNLSLSKPAKGSGGDKYTTLSPNDGRERAFYIPQKYSRIQPGNKPETELNILVQSSECESVLTPEDWIRFTLVKQAKGSGDDRYSAGNEDIWKGDIYLPKEVRNKDNIMWLRFL